MNLTTSQGHTTNHTTFQGSGNLRHFSVPNLMIVAKSRKVVCSFSTRVIAAMSSDAALSPAPESLCNLGDPSLGDSISIGRRILYADSSRFFDGSIMAITAVLEKYSFGTTSLAGDQDKPVHHCHGGTNARMITQRQEHYTCILLHKANQWFSRSFWLLLLRLEPTKSANSGL